MKIDIIIATFNRAELLKRAVGSILSANRGGQFAAEAHMGFEI
jgi:glycosyltransferase involved in cell wall biosynthesis